MFFALRVDGPARSFSPAGRQGARSPRVVEGSDALALRGAGHRISRPRAVQVTSQSRALVDAGDVAVGGCTTAVAGAVVVRRPPTCSHVARRAVAPRPVDAIGSAPENDRAAGERTAPPSSPVDGAVAGRPWPGPGLAFGAFAAGVELDVAAAGEGAGDLAVDARGPRMTRRSGPARYRWRSASCRRSRSRTSRSRSALAGVVPAGQLPAPPQLATAAASCRVIVTMRTIASLAQLPLPPLSSRLLTDVDVETVRSLGPAGPCGP